MREQRRVIIDTTPLIALALINQLDVLRLLYTTVLVPPTVAQEVMAGGVRGIGQRVFDQSTWLHVTPLADPRRAELLSDLDQGEAEVLALAQEINADLVIIDERLGRLHATRLGLTLTGTIGVLLKAKQIGYISAIKPFLFELQHGGIWLDHNLIHQALTLADEVEP